MSPAWSRTFCSRRCPSPPTSRTGGPPFNCSRCGDCWNHAATGLAATLLTAEDLEELGVILERSRAAATVDEFVAHDIAFHLRIVEAVGNPVLSMLLRVLSTRTQRVRIVRGSRTQRAVERAHAEHEEILRALRARDALLAVSAATVHVAAVEHWLAASWGDADGPSVDG